MSLTLVLVGVFVVGVVLVLFVGYGISTYNTLVSLKKRVDQSKQNIDVLLKQRQDELTKLIDAASEFMDHEKELLTELTEARERAEQAETPGEQATADQMVRNAMATFNARVEEYPDLKSQGNMMQFQNRISDIENQIADRREFYNETTTRYNTRISQFPYVLMARQFGFTAKELFEASEEDKKDVDVAAAFA
ncbi:LemA family protein [Natronobeatus ordinarius]|uniref:LemA family protein n=1 Tax=Natronobeatus ordinarius TaxID=2963433 RepID=UPI0020CC4BAC|nr:LemA family protein [Natronobeatus ordinarius]